MQGWGAVPQNEVPPLHQQFPTVGLDTDLSFTIIWFKQYSEQVTLEFRPKAESSSVLSPYENFQPMGYPKRKQIETILPHVAGGYT